jgi:hypothetical protein
MDNRRINHILAIDAGTRKSGWVLVEDNDKLKPVEYGFWDNEELEILITDTSNEIFHPNKLTVIFEDIQSYGMPVGVDVFETVKWLGELRHVCKYEMLDYKFIKRSEVKNFLCKTSKASDKNVRQAIIDYYGGDSVAIGGKKCLDCKGKGWNGRGRVYCKVCAGSGVQSRKGVLKGISGHVWSALGVAITHYNFSTVKENVSVTS